MFWRRPQPGNPTRDGCPILAETGFFHPFLPDSPPLRCPPLSYSSGPAASIPRMLEVIFSPIYHQDFQISSPDIPSIPLSLYIY